MSTNRSRAALVLVLGLIGVLLSFAVSGVAMAAGGMDSGMSSSPKADQSSGMGSNMNAGGSTGVGSGADPGVSAAGGKWVVLAGFLLLNVAVIVYAGAAKQRKTAKS